SPHGHEDRTGQRREVNRPSLRPPFNEFLWLGGWLPPAGEKDNLPAGVLFLVILVLITVLSLPLPLRLPSHPLRPRPRSRNRPLLFSAPALCLFPCLPIL